MGREGINVLGRGTNKCVGEGTTLLICWNDVRVGGRSEGGVAAHERMASAAQEELGLCWRAHRDEPCGVKDVVVRVAWESG